MAGMRTSSLQFIVELFVESWLENRYPVVGISRRRLPFLHRVWKRSRSYLKNPRTVTPNSLAPPFSYAGFRGLLQAEE
jgi:hypothetical protein